MTQSPLKMLTQVSPLVLLPALLGGAVAAVYGGWFLFEVISASVGRGGYQYGLELPAAAPVKVQEAPFCAQKSMKWVGCY
jgi:hypothetical protein